MPENLSNMEANADEEIQVELGLPVSRKINSQVREMEVDRRILDTSLPLWDRIHLHLSKRMLFAYEICPPMTASIGGHLADIHQADPRDIPNGHDCPFYFFKGQVEILNIPVDIISPAGLSKSHTFKQFFEKKSGICPIRAKYSGLITEAGFVGRENPGMEDPTLGDAHDYRNGFLLFNEISNLLITNNQSHSGNLVNQVMEALSERRVTKRTGGLNLSYATHVTIWGGTQPRRFDLSQGLGRRFVHVTKAWTPADVYQFKDERETEKLGGGASKTVNMKEVNQIREEISDLLHNANV